MLIPPRSVSLACSLTLYAVTIAAVVYFRRLAGTRASEIEATKGESQASRDRLKSGPYLLPVHSASADGYEVITFRNTREKAARHVSVAWLRVQDDYGLTRIPEELFVIERAREAAIKIQPIRSSFAEVMKLDGRHWIRVEFEDDAGTGYRQEFEVKLREDGSVEFKPADLKLQSPC